MPGIVSTSTGGALTIGGSGQDIRVSGADSYRPFYINTGASLTLQNIIVRNGYCGGVGGGVYNKGTLVVRDSSVNSNRANEDGGGIYSEGTLTLENTNISANTTDLGSGGGLYIYRGSASISGSNFQSNSAAYSGGGIYNRYDGENTGGDLVIQGTTFFFNDAFGGNGGAIANESDLEIDQATFTLNTAEDDGGGLSNESGNYTITNSLFSYNSSDLGNGGGMYVSNASGYSYCEDCTFSHNITAEDGGGFYIFNGGVTYRRTLFFENIAHGDGGGGYNYSGFVYLYYDTFDSNTADQHGGGFYNDDWMRVRYSTFSGNSAQGDGGGIYHYGVSDMIIENNTFYDNSADEGGGLFMLSSADITNCTLSANSASVASGGGGLYANTSTYVKNSIIANSVSGGECDNMIGGLPTNSGNNIDSGTSCGWGSTNGSMSNTNPLLGTLKDNGGFTETMALLAGSAAIDGVTYNAPNECPSIDQRDFPRPYGVYCDIGAVEQYYRALLPIVIKN